MLSTAQEHLRTNHTFQILSHQSETIRLVRDKEKEGAGGGLEVGGEGDYIPIATLSPPE